MKKNNSKPEDWPIERIKKAIEHLKTRNQIWQQRFKKSNNAFTKLQKEYEMLLKQKNEEKP